MARRREPDLSYAEVRGVIRAARRLWSKPYRRDRSKREARHAMYETFLYSYLLLREQRAWSVSFQPLLKENPREEALCN